MWSDIEAKKDYLNYLEVAEVVSEILLDAGMRPVSIGIFGTWGTGKSSLLNLIEDEVTRQAPDEVIVIRFDAWLYQGFDDARAALMDVIARNLYQAAKDNEGLLGLAKRFLARVNTMRTLGIAVEVLAATHGIPMFGAAARAADAVGDYIAGRPGEEDAKAVAEGGKAVAGIWDAEKRQSPPEQIDAFRDEFSALLTGLDKTMVVFVDNLDRCLPAQTIHTLEALRLFLFMGQTAFVVAADEDMVRHSVGQHFRDANSRHITDYLDKLIQIPVRVPRLGVAEIRAYLCLLFAEGGGVDSEALDAFRKAFEANLRMSWNEEPMSIDKMVEALGKDGERLRDNFIIADRMAALLANSGSVEGNPRIVKRMLNAVRLRARIAERRKMPVNEEMVAKFALFERCVDPPAVTKLYSLINDAPRGKPELVAKLEANLDDLEQFTAACPDEWKKSAPFLWDWFGLKPALTDMDLRPLVYLGREVAPLRMRTADLSQASAEAVDRLRKITTMASPVGKAAVGSIPPGEHVGVMRELIGLFRSHAEWQKKPDGFTGALLLAEADDLAAAQLAVFIRNLPGNRQPWLQVSIGDRPWFKEEK